MVFHPFLHVAYVSNELNSSITVLSLNENDLDCKDEEDTVVNEEKAGSNGNSKSNKSYKLRMKPIQYVSTIDENGESSQIDSKNYVAEICLSPNGKDIYVSNRGHDSIAHFNININSGKVKLNNFIPTYGQCPRHFAMAPNGKYLAILFDRYCVIRSQSTNFMTELSVVLQFYFVCVFVDCDCDCDCDCD